MRGISSKASTDAESRLISGDVAGSNPLRADAGPDTRTGISATGMPLPPSTRLELPTASSSIGRHDRVANPGNEVVPQCVRLRVSRLRRAG